MTNHAYRRGVRHRVVAWIAVTFLLASPPLRAQTVNKSQTFRLPQFVDLFPKNVSERVLREGSEASERCDVEVDRERFRKAAEAAGPPFWAARDNYAPNVQGQADWAASALGVRVREAWADFQRVDRLFQECVTHAVVAVTWTLHAHAAASSTSREVGVIEGRVDSSGVTFSFRSSDGAVAPFEPDDYDSDFGYGHFQHTVLARRGDWVLLPRRPFPEPVWINLKTDVGEEPEIDFPTIFSFNAPTPARAVAGGKRIELSEGWGSNFVMVGSRGKDFVIREEVPSDMPCDRDFTQAETQRQARRARRYVVAPEAFVDQDKHLVVFTTYSRGC